MKREREYEDSTIGWVVKEEFTGEDGKVHVRALSRRFQMASAAKEFLDLALKSGHPEAYLEPVQRRVTRITIEVPEAQR